MPAHATHLIVVQDDAIPCANFATRTWGAVTLQSDAILVLFVPGFPFLKRKVDRARMLGEPFMVLPSAAFVPLVGIVYPRVHVDGLLAHTDASQWPRAKPQRLGTADDAILASYVRGLRLHAVATCPSLVDHRSDVPSVSKPSHRDGAHRRAAWFVDELAQVTV